MMEFKSTKRGWDKKYLHVRIRRGTVQGTVAMSVVTLTSYGRRESWVADRVGFCRKETHITAHYGSQIGGVCTMKKRMAET